MIIIEDKRLKRLIFGWLLYAVCSLVFAGIFAFLVAGARTPGLENLLPLGRDYIYVALVGHVVMAVVIWFLAFEGFLWTFTSTVLAGAPIWSLSLGWLSLGLSAGGTLLVGVSALLGLGEAELANYVPVLLTPVFYAGLLLFGSGILLCLVNTALTLSRARRPWPMATFGMAVAGVAVFVAFACFSLSAYFQHATGKAYLDIERLFWGGGHVLQFANTIAMVTAWVMLVEKSLGRKAIGEATAKASYLGYLLFILPAPFVFFMYDTASLEYKEAFTTLMRWGIGPATAVFIAAVVWAVSREAGQRGLPWTRPGFSSLVLSLTIFVIGGVIAFNISGVNTIIPAHYHCVIGAVTISFMGLFFEFLPLLSMQVYSKRMAKVQPYLYFLGIVLFAVGFFIAGSHGVQRKTYGDAQNLDSMAKLMGMAIMGVGGFVAIAGGVTFVWNALLSLLRGSVGKASDAA